MKPNPTGFAALPTPKETAQKETAQQQEKNGQEAISATLSFEVVQPTELDINTVKASIEQCPQYTFLVFEVKNSGNFAAERIIAEPSSNLEVLDCINCNAKQLKPDEKITVKLKACKASGEAAYVSFRSINSEEKRIGI